MRLRLLAPALSILMLTACQRGSAVTFTMTMDTTDAERVEQLERATERMIERRLDSLGQQVKTGDAVAKNGTLTVRAENPELGTALGEQITLPFAMRIMVESTDGSPDVTTENFGGFDESDVKEQQIDWITAGPAAGGGASAVINFTEDGGNKLKTLFEKNKGKKMGIFLRGVLMSVKTIDASDVHTAIAVDGIPNLELASTFADDVNVGLHVTFAKQ